jgi:hypothetical protein
MNRKALSAVLVIVGVAVFLWFVVDRSSDSEFNASQELLEQADSAAPTKTIKETLAVESEADYSEKAAKVPEPPAAINGSDEQLRQTAAGLSPALAGWLQPAEQIRKWVSAIDQLASFKLPTKNLPVVYNKEPFLTVETEKGYISDPGNYTRWDDMVTTVTAVDPKDLVIYYKKWTPFLEAAYNELGNPQSFDNQIRTMIEHMLVIEPLPDGAALHRPKVLYEYVDPVLENADSLSKWVWRLGPDNMAKLQTWLRELQAYL